MHHHQVCEEELYCAHYRVTIKSACCDAAGRAVHLGEG